MGKLVNLRHLEIEDTSLKFLPQGIGRMSSLSSLSKFIVGGGCKIEELKNLNLLQRKLEIVNLERVTNKDEAKEAELKNKQYLRDLQLSFEWNDSSEMSEIERIEGVLEGLEPHGNLNELRIESYIDHKFPIWMTKGTTLSNLRVLVVNQCNCVQLHFLESLEKLEIRSMPKVKLIGCEFLGIDSSDGVDRLFPKLESLKFEGMFDLEEWDLKMKNVMPRLKHLTVTGCPKLKQIPTLGNLEVLKTLEISGISSFECIDEELMGVSNGESIPTVVFLKLQKLGLHNCYILKSVPECIMSSSAIRDLNISACPLLMWTQSCLSPLLETLRLFNDAGLAQLKSLQRLHIRFCKKLECLPEELQHLTSLQELEISSCDILGPRCQKGGEEWNIISHIPNIQVDQKKI
ncbi:hypothetical protein GIB67_027503 [Kingdonia uniflora]|uniref:R13L1/DRL21-like LRR repeat region domain-containing protein n=1 Tax=Kingdonia uniflora TaxID=39325 RepID=A0A7J7MFG7_9MAGN|nr:hypothetical protein GIB67_027503 [Kingdonia uniflora]